MSEPVTVTLASGRIQATAQVSVECYIHQPPVNAEGRHADAAAMISDALLNPLGLPRLQDCAIPGDRIVVVADPATPCLVEILAQVMESLQSISPPGVHVTLLLPADPQAESWKELVTACPVHLQGQMQLVIHEPADAKACGYLASSASGTRVYLNKHLLDADLVVSIGTIGFDSQLGYRGTSSVIFPTYSDQETIREASGSGHPELTPDERRPMRDLVDEIGWLLGTQFTVQVVPAGDGGAGFVLCGLPNDVQQQGQELLDRSWRISVDEPFDLVVLGVPGIRGARDLATWHDLGHALEMACRIVDQGGRIAVVSDLEHPDGPAAHMLRRCTDPSELLKPLRKEPVVDSIPVSQLILATQRATIYLYSQLPTEIVEDMGVFALTSSSELQRLITNSHHAAVIPGASFAWCDIAVRR